MKVLVVFVSALVLVAHGNVTPLDEEDNVYQVQSEVVAGYAVVAGQEAGGPQDAFAEEVPVVQAFGAEADLRIGSPQEPAAENVQIPEAGVYIPIDTPQAFEACNLTKCANHCDRLGFKYNNKCKNNLCRCHN